MKILELSLSYAIGLLFLSTSFSKIVGFKRHLKEIADYRIIPQKYIFIFYIFTVFSEIYISCSLLINFQKKHKYTFGDTFTINLLTSNND
ncbi:MauE/DoxX family redox-associated membrane protein [Geobacillus thermoleovorans]|uniref:MauE/DoxX family redox-associated membrane protein n=1 Tax=Geobacillus thermoleovorans TaxID=33941 RepID=UPI00345BC0C3